jgi:hypothetical protein
LKLDEDDPIVPIPKDLSCPEKKISKEDVIEELCCHGELWEPLPTLLKERW